MKYPLVSVITITFNLIKNKRVKYIKQNFESVHSQTYPNIEQIVIDGGSKDGTVELLEQYSKKGQIVYYSEPDEGVYYAMNKGIEKANGKYIAFMNSDDFYNNRNAVMDSIKILEETGSDYTYGNTQGIYHINDQKLDVWEGDMNEVPFGRHFCHQSMFVKKQVLDEIGRFDTSYKISSDSDIVIRLLVNGYKGIKVNKIIASYRTGGLSQQKTEKVRYEHSKSFYIHIGKDLGLSEKDCYDIWNFKVFEEHDFDYCVKLGLKLNNKDWMVKYFSFLSNPTTNKSNRECSDREWRIILFYRKFISTFLPVNSFQRRLIVKFVRTFRK